MIHPGLHVTGPRQDIGQQEFLPLPVDLRVAAAALALTLSPLAAAAHHRDGHSGGGGNGHSAQESRGGGSGARAEREVEELEEDLEEEAGTRPCANGLARREVACVPPGQANRGVTTEDWIGSPFRTLDQANVSGEADSGLVTNADRLGLPELNDPAQAYAVAGGDLVIVNVATAGDGTTTYTYASTIRRAAFPGNSND